MLKSPFFSRIFSSPVTHACGFAFDRQNRRYDRRTYATTKTLGTRRQPSESESSTLRATVPGAAGALPPPPPRAQTGCYSPCAGQSNSKQAAEGGGETSLPYP
jgi:hypothetical protein